MDATENITQYNYDPVGNQTASLGVPSYKEHVMNRDRESAEQLLAAKAERPKEHVLKTPKKPTVKEKNKAKRQREAIERDLGK